MLNQKEYMKEWYIKNKDKYKGKDREKKKEYCRQYRIKNKEKIKEYRKQYYINNSEKVKEYNKQWKKDNPEKAREQKRRYYEKYWGKLNEYSKQRYKDNFEEIREYKKIWRKNNLEHVRKYNEQYRKGNSEKIRMCENEYRRNKRKTDLKCNLNHRMSRAINKSLKGNKAGRRWEDLVSYTLKDLIKHLKKTLPQNYTWQDYLESKLHIDHIIPISAHNYTKSEHTDFLHCWALENLQLLPARENHMKSNKLEKPFQPTLAMGEVIV